MRRPNMQQLGTLTEEQASAIINSYYERMHALILDKEDEELHEKVNQIVGALPPLLIRWFNDELPDGIIYSKISEIMDQLRQLKQDKKYGQ